jgi:septal ring factor EnvC (AmiA/AmiB activator)
MTRTTQAMAAILAAVALSACGKDSGAPIPARQAQALIRGLDTAQRQAANGSCGTLLETTLPALEDRARKLNRNVGSDTRETIRDGIAHLRQLATDQCNQAQQEQTTTSDTTTSETTTSETTTDTTTTDQTTTDTTTDTPPTTTETQTTAPPTTAPPTTTAPGSGGTPSPGAGAGAGDLQQP